MCVGVFRVQAQWCDCASTEIRLQWRAVRRTTAGRSPTHRHSPSPPLSRPRAPLTEGRHSPPLTEGRTRGDKRAAPSAPSAKASGAQTTASPRVSLGYRSGESATLRCVGRCAAKPPRSHSLLGHGGASLADADDVGHAGRLRGQAVGVGRHARPVRRRRGVEAIELELHRFPRPPLARSVRHDLRHGARGGSVRRASEGCAGNALDPRVRRAGVVVRVLRPTAERRPLRARRNVARRGDPAH